MGRCHEVGKWLRMGAIATAYDVDMKQDLLQRLST